MAYCTGKVSHRSVHADHKIRAVDPFGRVSEISLWIQAACQRHVAVLDPFGIRSLLERQHFATQIVESTHKPIQA